MHALLNRALSFLLLLSALPALPAQAPAQGAPANQREYDRLTDLAQKLGKKKDYAGAEKAIRAALKISDRDEWAWRHLSWCQRNQGRYREAVAAARAALRLRKTPWGYYDLAESAYGNLNFDLARKTADQGLALGRKALGDAWEPLRGVRDRVSVKEYTLTDRVDPKKCRRKNGTITLFVPQSVAPYQTATSRAVNAKSFAVRRWGDLTVMDVEPRGDEPFRIVSTIRVRPRPMRKALKGYAPEAPLPEDVKPFLRATPGIETEGPAVAALARRLRGRDDLETIGKVIAWFGKRFTYDAEASGTTEQIVKARRGHCDAMARLCSALCRRNGVACRPVRMNWADSPRGRWHSVCEVYVRGQGWVPVEPGASSFGTWPLTRWPSNALRLHYYPAHDHDAPHWVEHVRLGDDPPTCTARGVTKRP